MTRALPPPKPMIPDPPGRTTDLSARRVVVLAPHYDDEILGCGGLLARLTAQGAAVTVVFLSDGSGGGDAIDDRAAYAVRRKAEAEAVAREMAFSQIRHLGLPDGGLAAAMPELATAIAELLAELVPDHLLVPSPLERTGDHRATFAALHHVLGSLRGERAAAFAELEVLAYEVNHPVYAHLLVDVSAELPRLEAAMALYQSQQERHDYLGAALGIRRYRTLTLGPEVEAAEAYLRLGLDDFVTRSPAQLIQFLGGVPELLEVAEGPRVSVVVRTRDRPELLAEALASLARSTYRRLEVVLVNDGGAPPRLPEPFPWPVVRVDLAENLGRAGAADAGVAAASGEYVTFLDDDDLAAPEHVATLVALVESAGVEVAYTDAAVGIYELDGATGWRCVERRLPYSRDFDADRLLLDNYIPFNTLLFARARLLAAGPFDRRLPFFEDWELLIRLSRQVRFHHLPRVTCEYRHFRGGGHHVFGEAPRERGDFLTVKARVLELHQGALGPGLLARAVDGLRAEAVAGSEAARQAQRELGEVRRELSTTKDAFFRQRGELAALKLDHERLAESFKAQGLEEAELRRVVADQTEHLGRTYGEIEHLGGVVRTLQGTIQEQAEHLGRTYGEIERLNAIIRAMETTRAWRWHQKLQGIRGKG